MVQGRLRRRDCSHRCRRDFSPAAVAAGYPVAATVLLYHKIYHFATNILKGTTAMEKWEYTIQVRFGWAKHRVEDWLKQYGQEGWELVSVSGTWYFFKRKITP